MIRVAGWSAKGTSVDEVVEKIKKHKKRPLTISFATPEAEDEEDFMEDDAVVEDEDEVKHSIFSYRHSGENASAMEHLYRFISRVTLPHLETRLLQDSITMPSQKRCAKPRRLQVGTKTRKISQMKRKHRSDCGRLKSMHTSEVIKQIAVEFDWLLVMIWGQRQHQVLVCQRKLTTASLHEMWCFHEQIPTCHYLAFPGWHR